MFEIITGQNQRKYFPSALLKYYKEISDNGFFRPIIFT
jgi:hypothetical protein